MALSGAGWRSKTESRTNLFGMYRENKADDVDMFFAFEVLVKAEKMQKNEHGFQTVLELATEYFEKLSLNDKIYCEPSLKKLKS